MSMLEDSEVLIYLRKKEKVKNHSIAIKLPYFLALICMKYKDASKVQEPQRCP